PWFSRLSDELDATREDSGPVGVGEVLEQYRAEGTRGRRRIDATSMSECDGARHAGGHERNAPKARTAVERARHAPIEPDGSAQQVPSGGSRWSQAGLKSLRALRS